MVDKWYTIYYNGQEIGVTDYDRAWFVPDVARVIEVKDAGGYLHLLAVGPGIPISLVEQQPNENRIYT